ncbi:dsDNA nuclease domain-containing protein [Lewinella sp. IMCC34183]|uniref:dsDNA nuclease domain-containing protein n=1 Tax=Lewinella sp. IMCC34183 TaxID=2248762 RepID=UPI000E289B37|nr:dsDNA nuclease domain-containing protein [Lewinella sp. IMCC34183]
MALKSIHELSPLEQGGRVARGGFIYQDHVGAHYCLDMIVEEEIDEIWLEKQDDITLFRKQSNKVVVEFVQVKHNTEKGSRWSLPDFCRRESDKLGTSIAEKLLMNDRCTEDTLFQIAASYSLKKDDLGCLTLKRESLERQFAGENLKELINQLEDRLPGVTSPKGNGWEYLVKNCYWKKFPGDVKSIRSINILRFEDLLNSMGYSCNIDQRKQMYDNFLGLVRDASTEDLNERPDAFKINRIRLQNWLKEEADLLYSLGRLSKLSEKMRDANIPDDIIRSANYMRVKYKNDRMTTTYVSQENYTDLENEIEFFLHDALTKLSSGKLQLSGMEFYDYCLDGVKRISGTFSLKNAKFVGVGYMYDITNRCMHKFHVA